jgi:phosphoribosylformylglycinamidine synthase subunit PurL
VLATVRLGSESRFADLRAEHGVAAQVLGTAGGNALVVAGAFTIGLDELAAAHQQTLAALFS